MNEKPGWGERKIGRQREGRRERGMVGKEREKNRGGGRGVKKIRLVKITEY